MKKTMIHTPHDKLFKSSLQYPKVAKEFLDLFLPDAIKQQLDLNSIHYCQGTFVDEQLKLSQTDVLFQCTLSNQSAYIYVLAEHESTSDALISFWLMKYMVAIWDYHIKQVNTKSKALPLPVIVPLVFYTGDATYTAHRELWQLFGEHSLQMKDLLQTPFHLVNACEIPEETLTSHLYAGTMGFVLRQYFRKHVHTELLKIIYNLNSLEHGEHHRYVIDLMQYVLNIDEGHQHVNELITIIHDKMSPDLEKTMSSLADKLIAEGELKGKIEGELKGKIEGKLEGKLETARYMLDEGLDPASVSKFTRLPLEQITALMNQPV